MGSTIELIADDERRFAAYLAEPDGPPRAGLVVIQEIFGVTGHIRELCTGFAADGYLAIAPSLFDRLEEQVELDYDEDSVARGRELRTTLGWQAPLRDIAAARARIAHAGKTGIIGYCWGGSLAFLAACRLALFDGAVGYYGGQIAQFADEQPRCPLMLNFGETDPVIPPDDVAHIKASRSEATIHLYPAGHGFNCDQRADYDPESAALARTRTLDFFATHLG